MNHRVNARAHQYPWCPECDAAECEPCTTEKGAVREPHRVRLRIHVGEVFVVSRDVARARRQVRVLSELAAVVANTRKS